MTGSPFHSDVLESAQGLTPDFYLCALLAPKAARDDLIALAAFKGTIENICFRVSEPLIGDIRLQWWCDWLQGLPGNGQSGHPIADTMATVIARNNLAAKSIHRMLDAQRTHIYSSPVLQMKNLFADLVNADGMAFTCAAQILGEPVSIELLMASAAAGRAYGLVRLITHLRDHAARGYWPLPPAPEQSARNKPANSSMNLVVDKERSTERRASVELAIVAARSQLQSARAIIAQLPKSAHPAFLPLALVEPYFKCFERQTGDPLMMRMDLSPLVRRWILWRASKF